MSSILLKTEEIRAMMDEVRAAQAVCRVLNDRIQAMCPHEEYEDGMCAFAVLQRCKLCKACGQPKFENSIEIKPVPCD